MHSTGRPAARRGQPNHSGFTLVELMVVIGISATLLALATLGFQRMSQKYQIESQVKQMLADIDNIRMAAQTSKRNYAVTLNPNSYAFYSYSSEGDAQGTQVGATQTVKYQIQQFSPPGTFASFNNTQVCIDARGCLSSPGTPYYIAVAPGTSGPAVNAVALQTAKSNVGCIQGGSCVLQ